MLKKGVYKIVVFISLFCFFSFNVKAYDFINSSNQSGVNSIIKEIYSSKEQYEDLAGAYDETYITINEATSTSYWWLVGSFETTESEGKMYAKG